MYQAIKKEKSDLASQTLSIGKYSLFEQAKALQTVAENLDQSFVRAVELVLATKGRVIVCGMGKSGIVGKKIAATFASTGTPAFFVHPGEAYHGDLGMVTLEDTVILISYSGETDETIKVIPCLRDIGAKIISIARCEESTLAKNADVFLKVVVAREVCPNNLAPTTSTTATIAIGDALAVALIERRGFRSDDFARYHPGGSLGKRLLSRVKDLMQTFPLPVVNASTSLKDAIPVMTKGRMGMVLVMNKDNLVGVVTDGDLRRTLSKHGECLNFLVSQIMSSKPQKINENAMFIEAERKMLSEKLKFLIATNGDGKMTGVVEIFD